MERFGFFDAVFEQWWLTGRAGPDTVWRFVTYGFVHWGLLHALISVVLVLAMGKFASQVFRPWAIWAVFLAALAVGGLTHGLASANGTPLLGAYPGAYGLIGLFTWMRWIVARMRGENQLAAFSVILLLVALQSTVSLMDGNWHGFWPRLAGFATGFGMAWLVVPGGLAALRRKMQGR
jgi:membrane associated rhomboid family serine protease